MLKPRSLEDVIFVSYFLEFYFEPFPHKYHQKKKLMDILQQNMA